MLHSSKIFTVVLPWDPAFDPGHSGADYEKFVATREEAHLKIRPGQQPMRFECRPLTHAQVSRFLAPAKSEDEQRLLAFMLSVVRVRNGTFRDRTTGDWAPARAAEAEPESLRLVDVLLKPDECDAKFDWATIQEVGAVTLTRAFFDSPWTEPPYALPPSSVAALRMYRMRLVAEAKRSAQEEINSHEAAQARGPTSSEAHGAPGAVTATD